MDLTTTYLGKTLDSPLVASASPISKELDGIRALEDAGAAAIVLFSLFEEQLVREQQEMHYQTTRHAEAHAEALSYFPEYPAFHMGSEGYLAHIRRAKEVVDIPIIASLNGNTMGGWTDFARQIEQAGADALELNLYDVPTSLRLTGAQVEENAMEIVKAVRAAVDLPLAVKLSPYFSNTANIAYRMAEAGVDALVLFNRFYQPDIDLETLEVTPNILLSTPQDLRLPLRWIAILYGRVSVDFAATSGVHTGEDVIKLLMAGADVTMMTSALLRYGPQHIRNVRREMIQWMEENEYESVRQMHGSMSQMKTADPGGYERAQYVRAVSSSPAEFANQ